MNASRVFYLTAQSVVVCALLANLLVLPGASRRESSDSPQTETQDDSDLESMLIGSVGLVQSSSNAEVQCEVITLDLCSRMAYKQTRMPNFFKDVTQGEAIRRAQDYRDLVNSRCSPLIGAYVCELLTPVCLSNGPEAMKRFEIYPCRTFCRRVRQECEAQLARINQWRQVERGTFTPLAGFNCDELPYEWNGSDGPCHERNDSSTSPNMRDEPSLRPYQPQLDSNQPPFIQDTSKLSIHGLPFRSPVEKEPAQTAMEQGKQVVGLVSQLSSFGQTCLFLLTRYSHVLSIATVLALLAALNSKRLRRLHSSLRRSSSGKSSNSTTGRNSIKQSVSPSSSSRSLMLIAASSKQPASHKLLPTEQSPRKLLHGSNQKTLINLNGTLDKQQLNRYQLMQQAANKSANLTHHLRHVQPHSDKQQLFGTLDSRSTGSNQYDYIQVEPNGTHFDYLIPKQQQQQQQQLYSNILLSSPSHQVLLLNQTAQQASEQRATVQQFQHSLSASHQSTPRQQQHQARNSSSYFANNTSYVPPSLQYADTSALSMENQRSFQRRSRKTNSQVRPPAQFARPARTSASSSASSSGSSASSGAPLSPPTSSNALLAARRLLN